MVIKYNASCGSFSGNARSKNEDNFFFNKKHMPVDNNGLKNPIKCEGKTDEPIVYAVFDGMGGELKGEEASCLASEIFSEESKKLEELAVSGKMFMLDVCEKANSAINELTKENRLGTVGTTVAALYFSQDEAVACNVGDSKIFRIREKKMIQISQDHTDEKIMNAMGIKKKPVLLQFLGVPDTEMAIEPYISKGDIKPEDAFIICSDGVTDFVEPEVIYDFVSNNSADEAVRRILAEVMKNDGSDNATIIIVKFE